MIVPLLLLLVGFALLLGGAELLVRGSVRIAGFLRVSPLVIGLTVASFGTSMPELVVTVVAALEGQGELAVGNAIGSNVFNTLVVLGSTAVLAPIAVHAVVVRREVPVMLLATVFLLVLARNLVLGRVEGVLLLAGLVGYLLWLLRATRQEDAAVRDEYAEAYASPSGTHVGWHVLLALGGLALLAVGGRVTVVAAVDLARAIGVTERVIALTVVAAGTSLPELATNVVAAFRRQLDIAVGNVIGSNIFNILGILGTAALVRPLALGVDILAFDLPVLLVVSVAGAFFVLTGLRVTRLEGGLLLGGYVAYLALLTWTAGLV